MRIISGKYKGHRLLVPKGMSTRPTSDALRESLFNILEHRWKHQPHSVLDLFAGSGALGFEALSRGARKVVFVESDAKAVACIQKNAQKLKVSEDIDVLKEPLPAKWGKLLVRQKQNLPFDTVFCDPPYALNWPKKVFVNFSKKEEAEASCFSEETLLVVEESSKIECLEMPESWKILDKRVQGAAALFFYRKC